MNDIQQKFKAAVNVIQRLPKNGSFKPSNETMLKFYSLYKQATEGQCTVAKPYMWDVVKKAKWEAWSSLKSMSREDAMNEYVNEIKKIIEVMPQTDEVDQFMNVLGPFYELVYENHSDGRKTSCIDSPESKNSESSEETVPESSDSSGGEEEFCDPVTDPNHLCSTSIWNSRVGPIGSSGDASIVCAPRGKRQLTGASASPPGTAVLMSPPSAPTATIVPRLVSFNQKPVNQPAFEEDLKVALEQLRFDSQVILRRLDNIERLILSASANHQPAFHPHTRHSEMPHFRMTSLGNRILSESDGVASESSSNRISGIKVGPLRLPTSYALSFLLIWPVMIRFFIYWWKRRFRARQR